MCIYPYYLQKDNDILYRERIFLSINWLVEKLIYMVDNQNAIQKYEGKLSK